ncbi:MAG: hypothetical protein GY765_22625 [bacterium]|nr:hypothetical protein [bacterium]
MKKQPKSPQLKRLNRELDTLTGFELVICGYRSLNIFHCMLELVRAKSVGNGFTVIDIDVSSLSQVWDFQNLLKEKSADVTAYRLFNIIGMEAHVKAKQESVFLNHLNLIRDQLASDFPYGFFFWLPEVLLKRFALDAPDTWSWRNTVFDFEDEDKSKLIGLTAESYEESDFSNFTLAEKKRQMEYLEQKAGELKGNRKTAATKKKLARVYEDLGELHYLTGGYDQAAQYWLESLGFDTELNNQKGIADNCNYLGALFSKQVIMVRHSSTWNKA